MCEIKHGFLWVSSTFFVLVLVIQSFERFIWLNSTIDLFSKCLILSFTITNPSKISLAISSLSLVAGSYFEA